MSKHLGKIYNDWKVLNREYLSSFSVQCLCCNEIFIRQIGDIASGKSKHCRTCSFKFPKSQEKRKKTISGNGNPKWRGTKDIPATYFCYVKHNARVRKLEVDLTLEDLQNQWDKQAGLCVFTGDKLSFNLKNKDSSLPVASLDRIDSTKGYYSDNIQWVSSLVNYMKRAMKDDEFLKLIEKIHLHRNKK
jgi:hypothetical protein